MLCHRCRAPLSNRRLDSEADVFLTLVLKAGYFVTTSNTQPQPPLSCHKENKKTQKYMRWLLVCNQREHIDFGQLSYESECFQFQSCLLWVTWRGAYHREYIILRLQYINKKESEMYILLEWGFVTRGWPQLLLLCENLCDRVVLCMITITYLWFVFHLECCLHI